MRLLVQSLIRIFGIFYCIKTLDTAAGSIYAYILQTTSLPPEMTVGMPSPFAVLLPTIFIYLFIAFGLFLTAPRLSKLIVPDSKDEDMECGSLDIAIITSSSLLITGWVFIRIVDLIYGWMMTYIAADEFIVNNAEAFYLLTNLIILLVCFLSIKRMPKILTWLKNRS